MEKENKKKNSAEILKLIQENYEVNTVADLSSALKDMFSEALQQMMNAEFDAAIGYDRYDKTVEKTNYRNGVTKKNLKSEFGTFEFETPRDRNGEFEPQIVPKNVRDISGIEWKIISLYARGLSTREINEQIKELYGIEVSSTMISNITDKIIPEIKEWQNRPLDELYTFVFIDAVHFSVREENRVVKKAAYIVLGINKEGYKSIIGIWIGENESAKFWLSVLNDMKQRGTNDILIICSDNLTGIKEAINAAYPNAIQQRCIVHMIRNSVKYVSYKDLKPFCSDLKEIYTSKDEQTGYDKLQEVKEKWEDKYSSAFKTWEDNWDSISPFFNFSDRIRKIMYTTNTIESLNRQFRKYTKTKSVFPTDMSLLKCLYLASKKIEEKWNQPYRDWGPILSELTIVFEGRL